MEALNIQNLRKKSAEILKAEIGALMFNLGKTHIGWSKIMLYFNIDDNYKKIFMQYMIMNLLEGHINFIIPKISQTLPSGQR